MDRKFKKSMILMIGLSLVVMTSRISAQPLGPRKEKAKKVMKKVIEELELSPEQQEQIRSSRQAHRKEVKQLRQSIGAARQGLRDELEKAEPNEVKIKSLTAKLKKLLGKQIEQRVEGVLEMREILTPEQYQEFQGKLNQGREKMKKHFQEKKGQWRRHHQNQGGEQ